MTMANLIKRIAVSTSHKTGNVSMVHEFASSNLSTSAQKSGSRTHGGRNSLIELRSHISATNGHSERQGHAISFAPNEIRVTEDFHVVSEPYARSDLDIEEADAKAGGGLVVKSRSLDDVTEGESVKSVGQGNGESDDEAGLVAKRNNGGWTRLGR
jgi:hypothetical protein